MKKQTIEIGDALKAASDCATPPMEQFHAVMQILTGKWKGEILWRLVHGKQRFGELRRAIPGITQHMLTMQLRDLERNGLVIRTYFMEVPPRVEYELSPAALALRPVFEEIIRWAGRYATSLPLDGSYLKADAAGTPAGTVCPEAPVAD
jgi:DNA-binding HxlR family transcriptional regulator